MNNEPVFPVLKYPEFLGDQERFFAPVPNQSRVCLSGLVLQIGQYVSHRCENLFESVDEKAFFLLLWSVP